MAVDKVARRLSRAWNEVRPSTRQRERSERAIRSAFHERYWQHAATSVGATVSDLGSGFRKLSRDSRWTIARDGDVMLDNHVMLRIAGNKPLMYRLLKEEGVTPPPYVVVRSPSDSRLQEILALGRAVAKPASGSGAGRGVTTNIQTAQELEAAVTRALVLSDEALVEPFVLGHSYRLLYLDGVLIDAIDRCRPTVTGNGKSTIEDLINIENEQRINATDTRALSLITIDAECKAHLKRQSLALGDKLEAGRQIDLKIVVNQNNRFENKRVTDQVHPTIAKRCAEICKSLRIRLAGVDIIAPDISNGWDDQRLLLNEINTTPGLHHHVLVDSGLTWDTAAVPVLETLLENAQ